MIRRKMGYLQFRNDDAPSEAHDLEREGFTILRGVLSPQEAAELAADVHRVFDEFPDDERNPSADAWHMFRYEMLNRSGLCQRAIGHPRILEVIEPLLGEDCHIIANTAWRNPPSKQGVHGGERWHIDAGPHVPLPPGSKWPSEIPHPVFAVGTHIYLQDCGMQDGPTGVIPGSQTSGRTPPPDRLLDDDLSFEGRGVTPIIARAGDVGLFVSDVWHRRMPTQPGDAGRLFLQAHYGRRDIAQRLHTTSMTNQLSESAMARAKSGRERTLIGLHPPMFYDG
jgi:ectoine hydroxylase-related dioxygenase (phytanoyl-CoA dioxygenase family)